MEPIKKKHEFVQGKPQTKTNTFTVSLPQVHSLDEDLQEGVKIMLFGDWQTGKTYSLVGLLLLGYRIFVLSTDMGGQGITTTVKLALREIGREDLFKNVKFVTLKEYDHIMSFLDNPESVYQEFYNFDPDFLVWEGFSWYQQIALSEKIGTMPLPRKDDKSEIPDAVESGLFFEQPQWNMMRNATVRHLDAFLSLVNKNTGRSFHKIVTCQEGVKAKSRKPGAEAGGFEETKTPMLQGAGLKLSGAGFDLVIRTVVKVDSVDENKKKYYYETSMSENRMAKNRGFRLDAQEDGDMAKFWTKIAGQLGLALPVVQNQ